MLTNVGAVRFAYLLYFSLVCHGQTTVHASVAGRVTDPTGAAVTDAALILASAETGAAHRTTSGDDGAYVFPRILPGRYTLTAEKPGFEKQVREGVIVSISFAAVADLRLRVGDVSTTVSVEADASPCKPKPAMSRSSWTAHGFATCR